MATPHRQRTAKDAPEREGEVQADNRRERALEEGLVDTFPASDPVAVVQPARAEPDFDHIRGQGVQHSRRA